MKQWEPVDVIVLIVILIFGFSIIVPRIDGQDVKDEELYAEFLGEFFVIIALYIGNKLRK